MTSAPGTGTGAAVAVDRLSGEGGRHGGTPGTRHDAGAPGTGTGAGPAVGRLADDGGHCCGTRPCRAAARAAQGGFPGRETARPGARGDQSGSGSGAAGARCRRRSKRVPPCACPQPADAPGGRRRQSRDARPSAGAWGATRCSGQALGRQAARAGRSMAGSCAHAPVSKNSNAGIPRRTRPSGSRSLPRRPACVIRTASPSWARMTARAMGEIQLTWPLAGIDLVDADDLDRALLVLRVDVGHGGAEEHLVGLGRLAGSTTSERSSRLLRKRMRRSISRRRFLP